MTPMKLMTKKKPKAPQNLKEAMGSGVFVGLGYVNSTTPGAIILGLIALAAGVFMVVGAVAMRDTFMATFGGLLVFWGLLRLTRVVLKLTRVPIALSNRVVTGAGLTLAGLLGLASVATLFVCITSECSDELLKFSISGLFASFCALWIAFGGRVTPQDHEPPEDNHPETDDNDDEPDALEILQDGIGEEVMGTFSVVGAIKQLVWMSTLFAAGLLPLGLALLSVRCATLDGMPAIGRLVLWFAPMLLLLILNWVVFRFAWRAPGFRHLLATAFMTGSAVSVLAAAAGGLWFAFVPA